MNICGFIWINDNDNDNDDDDEDGDEDDWIITIMMIISYDELEAILFPFNIHFRYLFQTFSDTNVLHRQFYIYDKVTLYIYRRFDFRIT